MSKNYYLILGVSANASDDAIKAAFRRRARELHPDLSGRESDPFLEVKEAYGVLSDHERRRHYDEQIRSSTGRRRISRQRSAAEPFRPVETASRFRDVSLTQSFDSHRPSFDELFDRWWSNFESVSRPKAETVESLTVEIVIRPEDAIGGGRIVVEIPARAVCPNCGGHGQLGAYECWRCEGHGSLTTEYPLEVQYPPGIPDGYTLRIPLSRYGIENFYLTLLFRVSEGEV